MTSGLATKLSLARWIRALGFLGAGALGLLAARRWCYPLGEWLFQHGRGTHPIGATIVAMATTPTSRIERIGALIAISAITLTTFLAVIRPLRHRRRAELLVCGAVYVLSLAVSQAVLPMAVRLLLVAGCTLGFVLGEHAGPRAPERSDDERRDVELTLVTAVLSSAWGAWITLQYDRRLAASGVVLAAAFAIIRVQQASPEDLRLDALASWPLLALPLVGLRRAPSFGWMMGAVIATFALRTAGGRGLRVIRASRPKWTALAGVCAIVAILSIPHEFRELPTLNHQFHEAGELAWANSILGGRLMMADAGTIYGPLRAYGHTALAKIFGSTVEHLRQVQVLFNLAAVALLLAVAHWLLRGRRWALLWFAFLLLVASPLQQFVNYKELISFGWADLGRIAFPVCAVIVTIAAFAETSRRALLFSAGAACGVSVLYAQEMAIPIAAGLIVAGPLHLAATKRWSAREVLRRTAFIVVGGLTPIAVFFVIYAAHGRLGLFLRTVGNTARLFGSGQYAGLPFPVEAPHFTRFGNLLVKVAEGGAGGAKEGMLLEFVLPVAVYVLALVVLALKVAYRRWTTRDSVEGALVTFGLLSFASATARSDYLHIIAVSLPSLLLLPSILVDAVDGAGSIAHVPHAPVRLVACAVVAASFFLTGWDIALSKRIQSIAKGEEVPSMGAPYVHPNIPRAGDVRVPDDLEKTIEEVRRRTAPTDPIYVRIGFTEGGEVFFLANRKNATRYDLLCEIFTEDDRANLLDSLRKNPPKVIVGSDSGMPGPEVTKYIEQQWPVVTRIGGYELRTR